jgi:hypothetical protein
MAEVYVGEVRNGVVVFEGDASPLADGTKVRVEAVDTERELAALRDLLLSVAGKAEGLPADLAEQHDHYLHGQPKR